MKYFYNLLLGAFFVIFIVLFLLLIGINLIHISIPIFSLLILLFLLIIIIIYLLFRIFPDITSSPTVDDFFQSTKALFVWLSLICLFIVIFIFILKQKIESIKKTPVEIVTSSQQTVTTDEYDDSTYGNKSNKEETELKSKEFTPEEEILINSEEKKDIEDKNESIKRKSENIASEKLIEEKKVKTSEKDSSIIKSVKNIDIANKNVTAPKVKDVIHENQITNQKTQAQTIVTNIKGIVINSRNNVPIKDAEVIVYKDTAFTVSNGKFILASIKIPSIGFFLKVEKDGFSDWSGIIETNMINSEITIKLEPKTRVVLVDFKLIQEETSLKKFERSIPEIMKTDFVECKDIEVLARGNFIDVVGEIEYEQRMKGLFDANTIAKTGKMVGANYIITGRITKLNEGIEIQAQMTHIESATIILNKSLKNHDLEKLTDSARWLSSTMIASLAEVTITKPNQNDTLPRLIDAEGTNSCLPNGWKIWISVLPYGANRHYPQEHATVEQKKWIAPNVYLGSEDTTDVGRKFGIYLILADPSASKIFNNYLLEETWTGFRELPDGARICDHIVVIRE